MPDDVLSINEILKRILDKSDEATKVLSAVVSSLEAVQEDVRGLRSSDEDKDKEIATIRRLQDRQNDRIDTLARDREQSTAILQGIQTGLQDLAQRFAAWQSADKLDSEDIHFVKRLRRSTEHQEESKTDASHSGRYILIAALITPFAATVIPILLKIFGVY